jgi:mRNA-degrading endonuclease RelE of RelBE toxin-antitoxin system
MIDIFTLPIFDKKLKHYRKKNPLLKKDYAKLLDLLETNPEPTTAIALKDKVYKIRMANSSSNKGKSAGYRVYYFYKDDNDTLKTFSPDKLILDAELFEKAQATVKQNSYEDDITVVTWSVNLVLTKEIVHPVVSHQ